MSRRGVSREEVERAVEELVADGIYPSAERVRDKLGRGSMSTIHKHMTELWPRLEKWSTASEKKAARHIQKAMDLLEGVRALRKQRRGVERAIRHLEKALAEVRKA